MTLSGHIIHIRDFEAYDRDQRPASTLQQTLANLTREQDVKSMLGVPLLREGRVIGGFLLRRKEVGGFDDTEIALVQSFAEQAVIAIASATTLRELRARRADLQESLEQQTATAEVLQVINASPGNLTPVFDAMLEKALSRCEAAFGGLWTYDGKRMHAAAMRGVPALFAAFHSNPFEPVPGTASHALVCGESVLHVPDITDDEGYRAGDPAKRALGELGGARTALWLALRKDQALLGTFMVYRQEVRPFSDKQIALLQNFADQAVIAIENARLLTELRESLEQQTATAEVLKVISRAAFDLQTVLQTLIDSAARLCNARSGAVYLRDDQVFRPQAVAGNAPGLLDYLRQNPYTPSRKTATARAALTGEVQNIADVTQDPEYEQRPVPGVPEARSLLSVPLMREGRVDGVITLNRDAREPFSERQVELVRTFADQAVIAIENARLFDAVQERSRDLAESLEYQTATSEVLKVISGSSFDLTPVFQAVVATAVRLCRADSATIYRFQAGEYCWAAGHSLLPEYERIVQADPDFDPDLKAITTNRTVVAVPLVREGRLEGVFVLGRTRVEAFTQRQIELVQTFADQALIAIENARLFNEVQARTRELAKSLDDLRTAQDRLIQTEKLASLGQLTAGIAHEIKNPLNFVNNFSSLSVDLIDELHTALTPVPLDAAVRAEVKEVTDLLRGNLEKVVQHGKRADGIVKNMLLHARESGGERRSVDLNATVDEALNLAYHGARAEKPGFTITLERNFDPAVGSVELYPQEFTRVMLNLISNGFYAATRKASGAGFQPTLTVTTEAHPSEVLIRVRDNGTGIPDSARARLFEPFFTTKPAGEGTGLGLSLSHDIIVKQHSGSIAVDSQLGEYTEFTISLPRASAGAPA
jgi:GAF domain-containing protein